MSVLPAYDLVAICQKFGCPPKVIELASQTAKPSEFIAQLRAENMGQEAVQSLSRMMPKEKAVEWAEQSARVSGEQAGLSPEEVKALDAAKAWSANPTEEARSAAAAAAAKLPANSPSMWAANAAAFSKPMSLPEGAVPLAMADDLTAQMAAGSVQLSAAKLSPTGVPDLAMPEFPQAPTMPKIPNIPETPVIENFQQEVVVKTEELTTEQRTQMTKQLELFLDKGISLAKSSPNWS